MPRILVIAPHWIGDAVMSLPLITLIQTKFPNCSIDVLCTPWVGPIYRASPAVETIIERDFQHGAMQWSLRRSTARELKKQGYEMAFVLPNSMKSALIPWLAGIPKRIGYQGEFRFRLINHSLPNPSRQARTPMMAHYARLIGVTLGQTPDLQNLPLPKLSIDPALAQWAANKIDQIGGAPLYGFAPWRRIRLGKTLANKSLCAISEPDFRKQPRRKNYYSGQSCRSCAWPRNCASHYLAQSHPQLVWCDSLRPIDGTHRTVHIPH
jgi:heptosyltransferase-2